MGETSIEWADYTYNPWIGCEKVSPGCKNCYASVDTMARRYESAAKKGRGLPLWGPGSTRHITTTTAAQVRAWNQKAGKQRRASAHLFPGERLGGDYRRPRVFCASEGDVFESPRHEPAKSLIEGARPALWELIEECDELDWLLVTKRPENVPEMVPPSWLSKEYAVARDGSRRVDATPIGWPSHVWLGTSVENQEMADERIPHLLAVPAPVRFLSCEPLLGAVNLSRWIEDPCNCMVPATDGAGQHAPRCRTFTQPWGLDWVIVGGESGPNARPMHPDWARGIRDQCVAAGVAVFVKQMGSSPTGLSVTGKGGDMSEWPNDLRVQQVPS